MELAGAIRDEFLTCNICLEAYTQPKQLPCLHTFCRHCLSRYITQTVGQSGHLSVPCPICRRSCIPANPDPRKLQEWADQFPDNFFVVSLRETLETRRKDQRNAAAAGGSSNSTTTTTTTPENQTTPAGNQTTTYFMGKVNSCSQHLSQLMTHYCLAINIGICDLCLADTPHKSCGDRCHLDYRKAQQSATRLFTKYRHDLEQVKQDAQAVRQSFSRKPRLLQTKREEVEVSVSDYFSILRSRCAKLLFSKEKEMMETLVKAVDDERQKVSDSQGKCDDLMMSMNNTMALFDTLILSGPFNAMHVLARVEQQITNTTRLISRMDQEAESDAIQFTPPSQNVEDVLSSLDMGQIITDFGVGDMAVRDSSTEGQGAAALEDRLARLSIDMGDSEVQGSNRDEQGATAVGGHTSHTGISDNDEDQGETVVTNLNTDEGQGRTAAHNSNTVVALEGSVLNLESRMSELKLSDVSSAAGLEEQPDTNVDQDPWYPSAPAPPLDEHTPPPYLEPTEDSYGRSHSPLPTAPPISDYRSAPEDLYARSGDTSNMSPAMAEAFLQSRRKEISCKPLMVFSGNLPNESRRGGICGAAKMDQVNRAAFVDRHNHSIKIIDLQQAQIVGFLHLGNLEPWDITFMSTRMELVVTCPGSLYLLFIPTDARRLEISYYLTMGYGYCCVAYLKDDIFSGAICAPFGQPAVHVFDLKGGLLREILPKQFSYPRTIFSDCEGSQMVISDWTSNTVVLVTSEGQLVCRYKEAPGPKGVAMSELTGLLHVLDGKWGRLHLLDVTGHCVGNCKVDGCRDPRMVVVVPTNSRNFPDTELTVIADGNNALHVMSLSAGSSYYKSASPDSSFVSAV